MQQDTRSGNELDQSRPIVVLGCFNDAYLHSHSLHNVLQSHTYTSYSIVWLVLNIGPFLYKEIHINTRRQLYQYAKCIVQS